MTAHTQHSARLHALTAALCALLLLVALCVMDANHAPWWALLGTQGALLVATASAAMWLDRSVGERREARGERGQDRIGGPFTVTGRAQYHLPGLDGRVLRRGAGGPRSTEQVFWIERGAREDEEDER